MMLLNQITDYPFAHPKQQQRVNKNALLKLFVTSLLICGLSFYLSLQAQGIEWEVNYGGTGADVGYSIQQTPDTGFIIAGTADSANGDVGGNNGARDYWVTKLSQSGNLQWENNFGGAGTDRANAIEFTSTGYIVAGKSNSSSGDVGGNNGYFDYWVAKLGPDSTLSWESNYGTSASEELRAMDKTNDGGYILAGAGNGPYTYHEYWLVKLNDTGKVLWEKAYGGYGNEEANSVQQTSDGGYIMAGFSKSSGEDVGGNYGKEDIWVVKVNDTGKIMWEQHYGGSDVDIGRSVRQTLDGGYIVAGSTESSDYDVSDSCKGWNDVWVLKLSANGTLEWENNYGGSSPDYAYSVELASTDSGYIVGATTQSYDGDIGHKVGGSGNSDYWVLKLSKDSLIEWENTYGGSYDEAAYAITSTIDGGYVTTGYSTSSDGDVSGPNKGGADLWTVKICQNTYDTLQPVACSYTVPSGSATYTSSGTYHDTIPNAKGCDSILTIHLSTDTHHTISGSVLHPTTLSPVDNQTFVHAYQLDTATNDVTLESRDTLMSTADDPYMIDSACGHYLIQAYPTFSDTLLTTYYPSLINWQPSTVVPVLNTDTSDISIVLQKRRSIQSGNGQIKGKVIEGKNYEGNKRTQGDPLANVNCAIVETGRDSIYQSMQSDSSGIFEFSGLPEGNYRVIVDAPGKPVDTGGLNDFSISQQGTAYDSVIVQVDSERVQVTHKEIDSSTGFSSPSALVHSIYPNPAEQQIMFQYKLSQTGAVMFKLYNSKGRIVKFDRHPHQSKGRHQNALDVHDLPPGIYVYRLHTPGHTHTGKVTLSDH